MNKPAALADAKVEGKCYVPKRITDEIKDPDLYVLAITGDCMEPVIGDGDLCFISPATEPKSGDFACIYPADGSKPLIKKLVTEVPPRFAAGSEVIGVLLCEMLSPPKQFIIPIDEVEAVHTVVGWMQESEHEALLEAVGAEMSVPV